MSTSIEEYSSLAITTDDLYDLRNEVPAIAREFGWTEDDLWIYSLADSLPDMKAAKLGKYHLINAVIERLKLGHYHKFNGRGGTTISGRYDREDYPTPARIIERLPAKYEFVHGGELTRIIFRRTYTEFVGKQGRINLQVAACGFQDITLATSASQLMLDLYGICLDPDMLHKVKHDLNNTCHELHPSDWRNSHS